MLPAIGDELDSSTLHLYLKDSTFVEYFNSFLLLPAFSSRLFFDQETGYFEPVRGEGARLCWGDSSAGEVTPSSSQATLYLTDDNLGPSLDRHQSWSWVIEHRLPLFLKSDIFSEYKLCKLLSNKENKSKTSGKLPLFKNTSTNLATTTTPVKSYSSEEKIQSQAETSLPAIVRTSSSLVLENVSSTSLQSSPRLTGSSGSDVDVNAKRKSKTKIARQRSRSVDLSGSKSVSPTSEELQLVDSKSGMSQFWKFLRGKAGERNWLFWLDAERVTFHTNPLDQQRLLKELRERYIHSGGPLVLPAEVRNKVGVSKASQLNIAQVKDLQNLLMQGLKEYWCPRFVVHHYTEGIDSSRNRTHVRPASTVPLALPVNHGQLTNYRRIATPLTPTGTPTFRRLASGRNRSFSSPSAYRKAQEERTKQNASKLQNRVIVESTVNGDIGDSANTELLSSRRQSRRVWDTDKTLVQKGKQSHFNKMAKYTLHHVPDTNSRCASRIDGRAGGSGMCESRCTIMSVSGTPVHSGTPTPAHTLPVTSSHQSWELYTPLISCLSTEHRKAGGYFQRYLENIGDKVYLYCIVFWRQVQDYKALFIGASFNPCTVEMKAKTLFGRFISEGCEESIGCSLEIMEAVSSNLWPAYEDLFDSAEEHALSLLLFKWVEMVNSEDKLFQKLDSAPQRRSSGHLSRRASATLEELEEEQFSDEVDHYDESCLPAGGYRPGSSRRHSRPPSSRRSSKNPSPLTSRTSLESGANEHRAVSLNDIMKDRTELDHFKIFLNEQCAAQDLMCWMEIEAFRGVPVSDKTIRNMKAKQLKGRYFTKSYLFGANSPASKEAQRLIIQAGGGVYTGKIPARPRTPVFIEAQKHVRTRLERKWLTEFMATPDYLARNRVTDTDNKGRRMSRAGTGKDSTALYETSFANSHEAITFRKMLQDPLQVAMFLRYQEIKSTASNRAPLVRQDISFWLEVQKYKEMCHAHTTEQMLSHKAIAIIECYLQSAAPPKVQVNVPLSVAEDIARKHKGPYLFREAQAAVFKHLYSCWLDYKIYVSGYEPGEIETSLDKLESQLIRDKNIEKDRRVGELMEEERKKLSTPRFETLVEREERLRLEKERAEIGDVQVAFRLSNPNDSYTYYTALPEDMVEKQYTLEHLQSDSKANKSPVKSQTKSTEPKGTSSPHTVPHRSGPLPMVLIKDKHKQAINASDSVEFDHNVLALGPKVSNQQVLLQEQAAQTYFHCAPGEVQGSGGSPFKRFPVRPQRRGVMRSQFAPHTTISMRRSGDKGGAFSYGAGLPQQSSLTVMNIETS